jgi:hypothetical protein
MHGDPEKEKTGINSFYLVLKHFFKKLSKKKSFGFFNEIQYLTPYISENMYCMLD